VHCLCFKPKGLLHLDRSGQFVMLDVIGSVPIVEVIMT